MTDLITEARELCEKATPGPWGSRIDVGKTYYVFTPSYGVRDFCCLSGGFEHEADAAFIARSRTIIPELCDALERAQAEVERLREQLDNKCDSCACEIANERDRLRDVQRWIPVTERLPDGQQDVLIWFDRCGGDIDIGYRSKDKDAWFRCGIMICYNVTHWMPLPAAPKEGAEK